MECIPPSWRVFVGLLGIGLQWTCARLYAHLANALFASFASELFWNAIVIIVVSGLVELARVPRRPETTEEYETHCWSRLFWSNKFGQRHIAILTTLWFLHGYTYFGLAHGWYIISPDAKASLQFVMPGDALAKGKREKNTCVPDA